MPKKDRPIALICFYEKKDKNMISFYEKNK